MELEAGTNRNAAARTALLSLPAIAAIGLGLIYAAGALLNGVSLRDADLPVGDTFPLIPIEDHLSRGLQVLVSLEALFVYLVVALGFVVIGNAPPRDRRPSALDDFLKEHRKFRRAILLAIAAVYLIGMFHRPLVFLVAALVTVLMLGIVLRFGEERSQLELEPRAGTDADDQRRLARFLRRMKRTHASNGVLLTAAVAALLVLTAAQAVTNPHPLPVATVETLGGETSGGPLIAVNDGDWYIGDCSTEPNGYRAIPGGQVSNTTVVPVPASVPMLDYSMTDLFERGIDETGCLDSVP